MLRCFIAFAILSATASAQSVVMSGGNSSIVMSGSAAVPVPAGPSEADLLKLEIDFLKSSLAAATAPPITKLPPVPAPQPQPPVVHPVAKPAAPPVAKSTVERWLVSEPWCQWCPAAKVKFIQSGGQEDHVLTIVEAKRRHGMVVTGVPFEYTTGAAVAKTKVRTTVQSRNRLPVVRTRWGMTHSEMVALHNRLHGGGSWTWPGDLATHLQQVHGVSTTRK